MWNMFPDGTKVVVDKDTREGRRLCKELETKGLDPEATIMTVSENKMVPAMSENFMVARRIPHVLLSLPDGEKLETEPVALSRAS